MSAKNDFQFVGVEVREERQSTSVAKQIEDEFIEEIEMTTDEPVEASEPLESPVEAPAPAVAKRKSGRKARKIEGLHASVEMLPKKNAIKEDKVLEITFESMSEKVLLELMCRELLGAYDVNEDSAPALLVYMRQNAHVLEGRKTYLGTLQQTAEGAKIGYSNVQKLTKKLLGKGLLTKETHGLGFSSLLESFFESLKKHKQILLTFEHLKEEQMESIDEEGHINESMAN